MLRYTLGAATLSIPLWLFIDPLVVAAVEFCSFLTLCVVSKMNFVLYAPLIRTIYFASTDKIWLILYSFAALRILGMWTYRRFIHEKNLSSNLYNRAIKYERSRRYVRDVVEGNTGRDAVSFALNEFGFDLTSPEGKIAFIAAVSDYENGIYQEIEEARRRGLWRHQVELDSIIRTLDLIIRVERPAVVHDPPELIKADCVDDCVICIEECSTVSKCCGAHYHLECLTGWQENNNTCPTCRKPM